MASFEVLESPRAHLRVERPGGLVEAVPVGGVVQAVFDLPDPNETARAAATLRARRLFPVTGESLLDPEVELEVGSAGSTRHYRVADPQLARQIAASMEMLRPGSRLGALLGGLILAAVEAHERGWRAGVQHQDKALRQAAAEGRVTLTKAPGPGPAARGPRPVRIEVAPPIEDLVPYVQMQSIYQPDASVESWFRAGVVVGRFHGGHPDVRSALSPEANKFPDAASALAQAKAMIPEVYRQAFPFAAPPTKPAHPAPPPVYSELGPKW